VTPESPRKPTSREAPVSRIFRSPQCRAAAGLLGPHHRHSQLLREPARRIRSARRKPGTAAFSWWAPREGVRLVPSGTRSQRLKRASAAAPEANDMDWKAAPGAAAPRQTFGGLVGLKKRSAQTRDSKIP